MSRTLWRATWALVCLVLALAWPVRGISAPLPPLNRAHLGLTGVSGPSPLGLSLGMDTRLTRFVHVDVGGFRSLLSLDDGLELPGPEPSAAFILRHGVFIAPGVRIPLSQPRSFNYEISLRGGAAALWLSDLDPGASRMDGGNYGGSTVASGLAGADLFLRVRHVGVRAGYKHYFCTPFSEAVRRAVLLSTGQVLFEAVYQFGGSP